MVTALKSAVIGTGVISKEHLQFLRHSDQAELVGVCDLSPAASRYAAEQFGAAAAYTDYRAMLDQAKPDVVHILTPPPDPPAPGDGLPGSGSPCDLRKAHHPELWRF